MKVKVLYKGVVDGTGKFKPDNPMAFKIAFLSKKNKRVQVTVRVEEKIRSNPQNSYLHLIIKIWADEIGYEPKELKEVIRKLFLEYYEDGFPLPKYKSTADLTTIEMEELCENIRRKAAECGVYLPLPNEVEH